MTSPDPLWKQLLRSLRSQWLASTLVVPLLFLGISTFNANQAAKEARIQSARIDRISHLQDSGKALDLALASYFQSLSDAELARRQIKVPGAYDLQPIKVAQKNVVENRELAQQALIKHASDVQALRGTVDIAESQQYMAALAEMTTTVDRAPDIRNTASNITVLGKLVLERNRLVDSAMNKISQTG